MDISKVVEDMKMRFPNKKILVTNENGFQEVVCEIEPGSINPQRSVAIAVVGKSKEHMHKLTTEVYEVFQGELTLYVDGVKHVLKEEQKFRIEPNKLHYAESEEAWFYVYSNPAWSPEDSYPSSYGG